MLIVSINKSDKPLLSTAGVPVRINGEPQTIRKVGNTIQWSDSTGTIHTRHLLQTSEGDGLITFIADSHD